MAGGKLGENGGEMGKNEAEVGDTFSPHFSNTFSQFPPHFSAFFLFSPFSSGTLWGTLSPPVLGISGPSKRFQSPAARCIMELQQLLLRTHRSVSRSGSDHSIVCKQAGILCGPEMGSKEGGAL